jgi:protein O-GlcNAc transferase
MGVVPIPFLSTYRPDYNQLGTALRREGRLGEAAACHLRSLAAEPRLVDAYQHLAVIRQDQGRLDEAVRFWRALVDHFPGFAAAGSNLLYALLHQEGVGLVQPRVAPLTGA